MRALIVTNLYPSARDPVRGSFVRDQVDALRRLPDVELELFTADPARREKRYDRALEIAGDVPVRALGRVEPSQVPVWVNGANAVLVPSERESFGLAVLEALACDVPVLATPVGVAPEVLAR